MLRNLSEIVRFRPSTEVQQIADPSKAFADPFGRNIQTNPVSGAPIIEQKVIHAVPSVRKRLALIRKELAAPLIGAGLAIGTLHEALSMISSTSYSSAVVPTSQDWEDYYRWTDDSISLGSKSYSDNSKSPYLTKTFIDTSNETTLILESAEYVGVGFYYPGLLAATSTVDVIRLNGEPTTITTSDWTFYKKVANDKINPALIDAERNAARDVEESYGLSSCLPVEVFRFKNGQLQNTTEVDKN